MTTTKDGIECFQTNLELAQEMPAVFAHTNHLLKDQRTSLQKGKELQDL